MRDTDTPDRRRRRSRIVLMLAFILSTGVIWQSSYSSFVVTTTSPGNSWATGNLVLTATDGNNIAVTSTPAFTAAGWWPNAASTVTKCVTVTYAGTLTPSGPAVLYASSASSSALVSLHTLSSYLKLSIETSTTLATDINCTGFAAGVVTPLFGANDATGSMMAFTTNRTGYGNGIGTGWTPAAGSAAKSFRFTVSFPGSATFPGGGNDAIDSDLINMSATTAFTWEVQK